MITQFKPLRNLDAEIAVFDNSDYAKEVLAYVLTELYPATETELGSRWFNEHGQPIYDFNGNMLARIRLHKRS